MSEGTLSPYPGQSSPAKAGLTNLPGEEASKFRVDNPKNKTSPVLNLM